MVRSATASLAQRRGSVGWPGLRYEEPVISRDAVSMVSTLAVLSITLLN